VENTVILLQTSDRPRPLHVLWKFTILPGKNSAREDCPGRNLGIRPGMGIINLEKVWKTKQHQNEESRNKYRVKVIGVGVEGMMTLERVETHV